MKKHRVISFVLINLCLSACVAKKDIILPTSYDRQMLQDQYSQCVTMATTNNYDNSRTPDEIVRASFQSCKGSRQAMLKDYPPRWQKNWATEVDLDIYKDEIAWIQSKRD